MSVVISISLFSRGLALRAVLSTVLLLMFIITSFLFEEKRRKITVSYIFVFFNLFITNTLVASFYSLDNIPNLYHDDKLAGLIGDYYSLYFTVVFICYLVVITYLLCAKKKVLTTHTLEMSKGETKSFLLGALALMCAYVILGNSIDILVPMVATLICLLVLQNKYRIICLVLLVMFWAFDTRLISQRYILIGTMLPVVFGFLICYCKNRKVSTFKMTLVVFLLFACVMLYGIVSEIVKLKLYYGGNYTLAQVFGNTSLLFEFIYGQIYRIFVIWYKLGGYAIFHVKNFGFFYGITYLKSFADVLGFEYVSLPKLVASYHGSNYAQPGLLAEGYANFGIIGAVLNICIVFFVMEYFYHRYYRNPSCANFLLMTVPFSTILLDGGTLNSAILAILVTIILCNLSLVVNKKKGIRLY